MQKNIGKILWKNKLKKFTNKICYLFLLIFLVNIFFVSFFTSSCLAENLGVIGQTYPIAEQDFLQFIYARLNQMQQKGEIKKIQDQMIQRTREYINRPPPVLGISKAQKNRVWLFDPGITVPYDLKDANGVVFAKAGTKVNPLQTVSLTKTLIFYNADDKDEVKWAKKLDKKLEGKDKLILVKGSIPEQIKIFKKPIYFDQEGRLVEKFHIEHVPATVAQQGLKLKISEVKI